MNDVSKVYNITNGDYFNVCFVLGLWIRTKRRREYGRGMSLPPPLVISRNRAFLLAEQMLNEDMNDGQRRLLMLTQVKAKLNDGELVAASHAYKRMKKFAPQSEEVIQARELIRAAVIKRNK
jgi:hypothetical protein